MSSQSIPVMLYRAETYHRESIKQCLEDGRELLAINKQFNGKKILLKPNLISGRAPALACTEATFIAAVAEWFNDHGAQVSIGDSPAFGSVVSVMNRHGISDALSHLNVDITPFKTVRTVNLSHNVKIGVAEESLGCDLFVNLPKIKAHSQMYVTMAVKNLFGIVCGMRKAVAHMKNGSSHLRFADLMLDLAAILPDNISIADGITVMHREGPVSGDPLAFCCLAMSRDPVALDTSMLHALQLDQQKCPVLRSARRRGLEGSSLKNITFPRCNPGEFWGSGFIAPQELNPVPFNPFRFFISLARRVILKISN